MEKNKAAAKHNDEGRRNPRTEWNQPTLTLRCTTLYVHLFLMCLNHKSINLFPKVTGNISQRSRYVIHKAHHAIGLNYVQMSDRAIH